MTRLSFVIIPVIMVTIISSCASSGGEKKTSTGLKYTVLQEGNGPKVEDGKEIHSQCVLSLEDGKVVWDTRKDGKEFTFIKGKISLIPGFEEAIGMMREGDRYKVVIPPNLGYGSAGAGTDIPPNATLIFDIEVVKVSEPSDL